MNSACQDCPACILGCHADAENDTDPVVEEEQDD